MTHKRVLTYKVTHNPAYNNFLISPRLLFEDVIEFVYDDCGTTVRKNIPMKYLGPFLKKKMFFHTDEITLKREYKGEAYYVDENVIYEY